VALAAYAYLLLGVSERINPANLDRIKVGMSLEEVEGILGTDGMTRIPAPSGCVMWADGLRRITVFVDRDGKVYAKAYFEVSLISRFRLWWITRIGPPPPF
jgi:hypothetical protein